MDRKFIKEVMEKIYRKMLVAAERNRGRIPHKGFENGMADDCSGDISWWTNGFWAGTMWQLYSYKRSALFRSVAEGVERKLDGVFLHPMGMDHDSGFRWLPTSNASRILTGSPRSQERLITAANDLAGRFNPAGNFIRAWNDWDGEVGKRTGWAIIDCMMNLPLLYLASELLRDPRFSHIAVRHAETVQRYFIRENGTSAHIAAFDPETGEFRETLGGQGVGVGSSWTRGQSWALYGFVLSYLHTKREDFLQTAEKVARAFLSRVRESGLVPADFDQPAECDWEDDSAAAISACGLIELYRATGKKEYKSGYENLLSALIGKRCDFSEKTDFLLTHCTTAYHDEKHNFPLVYADYFFIEALLKLLGKDVFIW